MFFFLALVASAGWVCVRAAVGRAGTAGARPFLLAQLLPFERNKVASIDPKVAFVQGYQAYQRRDFVAAIGRMQLASARFPELADYALFYLASAERDDGQSGRAAADFRRLTILYPRSLFADSAWLEYARLELTSGHFNYALSAAAQAAEGTHDPSIEQNARLVMARAMLAQNSWLGAYNEAQLLRQKFPEGSADAPARQLAWRILRNYPQAQQLPPLQYHLSEAALLLREGQPSYALKQIRSALMLAPPRPTRAQLVWLSAAAWRLNPPRMETALHRYLELAPRGAEAPRALNLLAHLCWHRGDTTQARQYFNRLARLFPHNALAPGAIFEIGRTYEEDGAPQRARPVYLRVIERYPASEAAADARFRAPFMLYMTGSYHRAAVEFSQAGNRAGSDGERDRFIYWRARALQHEGRGVEARRLLIQLAFDNNSNYYPALATIRVNSGPMALPATEAPQLVAGPVPSVEGPLEFHLQRFAALRALGLRELEPPELRAVEKGVGNDSALRNFVLAEMQTAGAWFDAIKLATRMASSGELDPLIAERIRYPRAFWDLVSSTAGRVQLDPFLVAALIRQESLFNPKAHSVSDARGLMQLLPGTAERYAIMAGVPASPLDLFDPEVSVQIGTVYLHGLMQMFGGDMFKAVAAYNAGEQAVAQWNTRYPGDDDQWVENISFHETRDYVKKVIGGMREYRLLYQSPPLPSASMPTPQSPG